MRLLPIVIVAAALLWPARASAAVLSFDGTRYTYTAEPGEVNGLRVTYSSGNMDFDDRVEIAGDGTEPAGCDYVFGDTTHVRCPAADGTQIVLGDKDDSGEGGDASEEIHGGPGADELEGDGGDDLLDGGPGDDKLEKGSPATRAGDDEIVGGDGVDEAWYSSDFYSGTEPVTVTLDGVANDGVEGESDNVQTENVHGSERDDLLIGGPDPNRLDGADGADEVRGGDGADVVQGGIGEDAVYGEGGDDTVYGGDSSDDLVDGGPGRDEIYADGICFYIGCNSGGNDQIAARDGEEDVVDCGGGYDSGEADGIDHLHVNGGRCEAVAVFGPGPVPAPAPGPAPAPAPAPRPSPAAATSFALRAPTSARRAALRRGLPLAVDCTGPCSIAARVLQGRRTLGTARAALSRAGTARLRVRLRHARRAVLTVRVSVTQGGATATRSVRVRVTG